MTILIAGGSGFIGSYLIRALVARGDRVIVLTRDANRAAAAPAGSVQYVHWNGTTAGAWCDRIAEVDAVVNLTGLSLDSGRWTASRKKLLTDSRVVPARLLVDAMASAPHKPGVFVSMSGVGYYGNVPAGELREDAPAGSDFLATLCVAWEREALRAERDAGVRTVIARTGLVLARNGGPLKPMLTQFKLFAGGWYGRGRQWWPWIHIDDEIGLILHAIDRADVRGPVNFTAPTPVPMKALAKALGRALRRPALFPIPNITMQLALGEMAGALVLSGQRAIPAAAMATGYRYKFTDLDEALKALFG